MQLVDVRGVFTVRVHDVYTVLGGEVVRSRYRRLKVRCEAPGEQQIKSPRGAARPRPPPRQRWEGTRDNVASPPKGKLEYFHELRNQIRWIKVPVRSDNYQNIEDLVTFS